MPELIYETNLPDDNHRNGDVHNVISIIFLIEFEVIFSSKSILFVSVLISNTNASVVKNVPKSSITHKLKRVLVTSQTNA